MKHFKGKIERVLGEVVEGWVHNPAGMPFGVILHIDDHPVAETVADIHRADLKAAGMGDGRSGFAITVPEALCDGRIHKVLVEVKGEGKFISALPLITTLPGSGAATSRPTVPVPVSRPAPAQPEPAQDAPAPPDIPAPPRPRGRSGVPVAMPEPLHGYLDGVRRTYLYGWIARRDDETPVALDLYIDNRLVASGQADVFRQDLMDAGIGDGRHGFHFEIPDAFCDDQPHRFDVRLPDHGDTTLFLPALASIDPKFATKRAAGPAKPAIYRVRVEKIVRGSDRIAISGWIVNGDKSAAVLPLELSLPDLGPPVTLTSLDYRGDLKSAGMGEGIGCFCAVFALREGTDLPPILRVRGAEEHLIEDTALDPAMVETANAWGRVEVRQAREVAGFCVDLGRKPQPLSVRLQVEAQDPVTLPLSGEGGQSVFDVSGPMAVKFSATVAELFRSFYARNANFALDDTQRVRLTVMGDDGQIFVEGDGAVALGVNFHLERLTEDRVVGWMVNNEIKSQYAEVDVYVDGVRYDTVIADRPRQDVINKGFAIRGGGFQFAPFNPEDRDAEVDIRFAPRYTRKFLPLKTSKLAMKRQGRQPLRNVYPLLQQAFTRGLSVILPVYNALDDVRRCLNSILEYTSLRCRVIVINDASPDPAIAPLLEFYSRYNGIEVHTNEQNLGYTATINRGIELAGSDDVIFLNSDTIVSPGWLQGLRAAAYSDPRIATATAVSNNSGAFSVPEIGLDNAFPAGFNVTDLSRLVRRASPGTYPRVPTGNGFCMYVRRNCLDQVGRLDEVAFPKGYGEENDFCMRAAHSGFFHVVDDRTLIYHKRSASFQEAKRDLLAAGRLVVDERYPEYGRLAKTFRTNEALLAARWRVRKAIHDLGAEPVRPKPRIAYVISTKTGGTPQTNADLMGAIAKTYEPWVIACDAGVIEVFDCRDGKMHLVEKVKLDAAIHPALHRTSDYSDAIACLLLKYAFELVHIRHLAWHGIDLPQICSTLGLPVVFSLHDYYTVCPNVKLLDENRVFCGGACTATEGECSVELWQQRDFPHLKNAFVHRWRDNFTASFAYCDAFVTTSPGARDIICTAFPDLADADFRVIPHGRTFAATASVAVAPEPGRRLRILVPGNISAAKGADIINDMLALDVDKRLEFHILGDAGTVRAADNVILHGRYQRGEFTQKVAAIKPHIGAVLSIWPETYCHTLTEMWACGVPVVGIDCGAVGERIAAHGGGWRLPLPADPKAVLAALLAIGTDVPGWYQRMAEVMVWQGTYNLTHSVSQMGAEYDALYRGLLKRRRTLLGGRAPDRAWRLAVLTRDGAAFDLGAFEAVSSNVISWTCDWRHPLLDDESIALDAIMLAEAGMAATLDPVFLDKAQRRGIPVLSPAETPGREGLWWQAYGLEVVTVAAEAEPIVAQV